MAPTIHGSVVLVGPNAILIRGPAGSGKSGLVLQILAAGATGLFTFTRLVADDRVELTPAHGRLIARPPPELAGLIEVRGVGVRRVAHEPIALVTRVIDLADPHAQRMPDARDLTTTIEGVTLPRLSVPVGVDPLPIVAAMFATVRPPF
jgi:serine kinase of HPr protein (carbohydrate metabolism regulator)